MQSKLIKPSYLVSLKTSVSGGISYQRIDLERGADEGGVETSKWETTRVIEDKDEYERATKARNKATGLIRKECHWTSFGLICPLSASEEFDEAVREAKLVADEFNREAKYTRINVFVLKGEIASSDEEAVRALSSEVMSLVSEMQDGIDKLSVKEIRTTANKARKLAATLGDEQSKILSDAVVEARAAATTILKRVKVDGESAEAVMVDIKRNDLVKARAAFLDYSEGIENGEALSTVQAQRFADIDVSESD